MAAPSNEARFWNKVAQKYSSGPIKDMAGYERSLARTRELLTPSDTVLEIGCGTGTTALRLADRVSKLVATDISDEMIAIARDKQAKEGCQNVEFVVADTPGVPGQDGSYDAALAFNLVHLLRDRQPTLKRLYALLKPGGLFISKTPCLAEMNFLLRLAVPVARAIGKAPYVSFFDADDLESDIVSAGFSIIERARHGSGKKDPRIFLVAQKPT